MRFYLGTHRPPWLQLEALRGVPLFLSYNVLTYRGRSQWPKANSRWALDSGGFTRLNRSGEWDVDPQRYADDVRRMMDEIGKLDFAAVQDWMCEPSVREVTRRSVREHQKLTIESYATLQELAPEAPWMPVLQGWEFGEYHEHAQMYADEGFDLTLVNRVGVGSVCRRQATQEIADLVGGLAGLGLRLHGFGVKTDGLARYGRHLASADSMAWSAAARSRKLLLPGCTGHKNCANCPRWAMEWRRRITNGGTMSATLDLRRIDRLLEQHELILQYGRDGTRLLCEDKGMSDEQLTKRHNREHPVEDTRPPLRVSMDVHAGLEPGTWWRDPTQKPQKTRNHVIVAVLPDMAAVARYLEES